MQHDVQHIKHSLYNWVIILLASVAWVDALEIGVRVLGVFISLGFLIMRFIRQRIEYKIQKKKLEQEDQKLYELIQQAKRDADNYNNRKN
jgi:hypothetical protein